MEKKKIYLILSIFIILIGIFTFIRDYQFEMVYATNIENINIGEFIGKIRIDKINLEHYLVNKQNYKNNIKYNIEIVKESNMPDIKNGNLILAAHSGNSKVSFFKNLYKLNKDDNIQIFYNNIIYNYKVDNIYNIDKTGKANIIRDLNKNTLTLITCDQKDKTKQIVIIAYLNKKEEI